VILAVELEQEAAQVEFPTPFASVVPAQWYPGSHVTVADASSVSICATSMPPLATVTAAQVFATHDGVATLDVMVMDAVFWQVKWQLASAARS
jgi:hypothetical protein